MSEYEMMQWAGLAAGAGVVGAGIYGLVRFFRKLDAIWPDTAAKYGLSFEKKHEGSALGNSTEVLSLRGPTLEVLSMREQLGNRRRTSTVVTAKGATPGGTLLEVSRNRPKAAFHLVTTGDAKFDNLRFVLSESKDRAKALLTPPVREALLRCRQWELRIACDGSQVMVSFGDLVTDHAALSGPIDVALAVARGAT
ncbi:MAG: hypothetical protein JNJ54_15740 [Myxococcaceae bacterium]|nr:hypothetical protein [Myxococcaceae bacterium]